MSNVIEVEADGAIRIIRLNRPEQLNDRCIGQSLTSFSRQTRTARYAWLCSRETATSSAKAGEDGVRAGCR